MELSMFDWENGLLSKAVLSWVAGLSGETP